MWSILMILQCSSVHWSGFADLDESLRQRVQWSPTIDSRDSRFKLHYQVQGDDTDRIEFSV